jgi:TatD DNase family protein
MAGESVVWFDTHCHLDDEQFGSTWREVAARARDAGIAGMVTIGTSVRSTDEAFLIACEAPGVWCSAGIHPHEADEAVARDWTDWLAACARRERCVAIGETGLDRYKDYADPANQRRLFLMHIEAARRTGKALVIHCRNAHGEVREILRAEMPRPIRGVVHCFSGTQEDARDYLDMGMVISLAGPVTFRNAPNLRAVAAYVPADRLVVETDAPYLAPEPMRGKRNEPAYVRFTGEFVAGIKGLAPQEFAARTTATARELFGIPR